MQNEHPLVVRINAAGDVTLVYHPDKQAEVSNKLAHGLGEITLDKRGAYVYPQNRWLRWAFHKLRAVFGSGGWVADWTRTWRCRWIVSVPGGCVRLPGVFNSHREAVVAEVIWIMAQDSARFADALDAKLDRRESEMLSAEEVAYLNTSAVMDGEG